MEGFCLEDQFQWSLCFVFFEMKSCYVAQADLASASTVSDHCRVEGLQGKKQHFGFEFPCARSRLRILVPSSTRTARLVVRGPSSHLAAPPAEGALVLDSLLGKQQLIGHTRPWEAHKAGHCSSDFSSEKS